jgi:anti-sigma B factor antagonist
MRVEGKGTFQNSVEVKRCFQSVIASGTKDFVVDLDRCPMMDSTFLGTLTGAALNLRESGGGGLSVLNANERNQHLLTSLGLDHILELDVDGTAWAVERKLVGKELAQCDGQTAPVCKEEQAKQVLQAHQALTEANPENACKFRDVIQFLEDELAATTGAVA